MKKLLLFLTFINIYSVFYSQIIDWANTGGRFSVGGNNFGAKDIAIDSAGNYYVIVYGKSAYQCQGDTIYPYSNSINSHGYVYKFNKDGVLQYSSKIGNPNAEGSFFPLSIECDEEGNVYVLGQPDGIDLMAAEDHTFSVLPHISFIV